MWLHGMTLVGPWSEEGDDVQHVVGEYCPSNTYSEICLDMMVVGRQFNSSAENPYTPINTWKRRVGWGVRLIAQLQPQAQDNAVILGD